MEKSEERHRKSEAIVHRFTQLTASTTWQYVDEVKLNFRTHHPQGLVKIGDSFYVSSVEITAPREKFPLSQNGYDRTTGEGIGHLFHVDSTGELVQDVILGDGPIYHPGGIDYDGESIWIPVAEYRPNSQSIIYRVNPETLEASEMFRCNDHIGGLAYNWRDDTLHGISWGSRKFYTWTPEEGHGWQENQKEPPHTMSINGSHYIDYQDCQFLEEKSMLCSGLNQFTLPHIGDVALGGLELVDLELHVAVHQVPVLLYSPAMRPMTQNPFSVELYQEHLRFYFIPDDDESTLYIYDALL
jgi:hypothetical protein